MSERKKVKKIFKEVDPDIVCLPISKEEFTGLKACVEGEVDEMALSNLEEIYAEKLKQFGKVAVPPPYLAQAYIMAKEKGIKLRALDLPEEEFTDFYCANVSTVDLVMHSQRVRRLKKALFKMERVEDFVLKWDSIVTKTTGLRIVEEKREEVMSQSLFKVPSKYKRVLAIIELERFEGVKDRFQSLLNDK